jgi:hypothetical protein
MNLQRMGHPVAPTIGGSCLTWRAVSPDLDPVNTEVQSVKVFECLLVEMISNSSVFLPSRPYTKLDHQRAMG